MYLLLTLHQSLSAHLTWSPVFVLVCLSFCLYIYIQSLFPSISEETKVLLRRKGRNEQVYIYIILYISLLSVSWKNSHQNWLIYFYLFNWFILPTETPNNTLILGNIILMSEKLAHSSWLCEHSCVQWTQSDQFSGDNWEWMMYDLVDSTSVTCDKVHQQKSVMYTLNWNHLLLMLWSIQDSCKWTRWIPEWVGLIPFKRSSWFISDNDNLCVMVLQPAYPLVYFLDFLGIGMNIVHWGFMQLSKRSI